MWVVSMQHHARVSYRNGPTSTHHNCVHTSYCRATTANKNTYRKRIPSLLRASGKQYDTCCTGIMRYSVVVFSIYFILLDNNSACSVVSTSSKKDFKLAMFIQVWTFIFRNTVKFQNWKSCRNTRNTINTSNTTSNQTNNQNLPFWFFSKKAACIDRLIDR